MANVRCPMCSKFNPPEAETCSFCGARLKPVRPGDAFPGGVPSDEPEEDVPDWLSGLRSDEPAQTPPPGRPAEQEEPAEASGDGQDLPDWLSRIRERAQSDTPPSPEMVDTGSEDVSDWLQDFQQAEDQTTPAEEGEPSAFWSDRLADSADKQQPFEQPQEESTHSEETTPDWLRSLSAALPPEPAPTASESEGMVDFSAQDASSDQADDEWMSKLTSWQSTTGQPPAGEEPPDKIDFSWMQNAEPSSDVSSPAEPAKEEPGEHVGFGLTGFLSSLEEQQTPPVPEQPAGQGDETELPSWLVDLPAQEEQTNALPAEPNADTPAQDFEVPDWLNTNFDSSSQQPAQAEAPDWFANEPETTPVEDQPGVPASETGFGAEGLPDWFNRENQEPDQTEQEEPVYPFEQEPDLQPSTVEFQDQEATGAEPEETAARPFIDESVPDWMRDFRAQSPVEGEAAAITGPGEQEIQPAETDQPFMVDLPDWLSEESPASSDQPGAQGQDTAPLEPAGEELARADLPDWVREMRPVETAMIGENLPAEYDQRVEKAGPLAGMRGVLPVEETAARYSKPPIYSAKLRVSEKQRSQASLFESILGQETQPLRIPQERAQVQGVVLRILVALIMIGVLFASRLLGFGALAVPLLNPPELLQMFEQINQQTDASAPVLLAVDFEPALAGEMRLAAQPVISHLMSKNAQMVIVSTVPTGPALAQKLLEDARAEMAQGGAGAYDIESRVVNLGFLPGGTISLLEFARQPRMSAPVTLAGDYGAWNNSFLREVNGLGDFSQVIVLTDSAETGRAWVEQVQPLMGDASLLMVSSAQAAPLLMPYLESEQIDGLTSGVLGGYLYAQQAGQTGSQAASYLGVYQVGLILGILMLLAGGVISGVLALIRRDKEGG